MTATEGDRLPMSVEEYRAVKRKYDIKVGGGVRIFELLIDEETKEVEVITIVNPYGHDREVTALEIQAILAIVKAAGLKLEELP